VCVFEFCLGQSSPAETVVVGSTGMSYQSCCERSVINLRQFTRR